MSNCTGQTVCISDPQTITGNSENRVTSLGHSHEISKASQTTAGIVKVVDHTTSIDPLEALSANQGRILAETLREIIHYNKDETINQSLDAALGYLSNRLTASYSTLALAQANAYKHAEASLIYVVNDVDVRKCGLYTIQGGKLVKAPWDALSSALTSEPFEVLHRIMTLPAGETVAYQGNVYPSLATLGKTIADGQAEISGIIQSLAKANGLLSRYILTDSGKTQEQVNTDTRAELNLKADKTYVDGELGLKANSVDVDAALSTKAPQSNTYTKAEVDTTFSAYAGGRKAYTTLALAQADQANLAANTAIEVTNDGANNGTYQWDGTTLTKSDFDPLTQAKTYTDTKVDAVIEETDITIPPVSFVDEDGWFYGGFYKDGSMETPLFKLSNYYANGFLVLDEDGWILLEQNTSSSAAKDWSQKNILLFGDSITETSNVEAGSYDSLAYRQNWLLYAFAMLEIKSFRNMARSGASYREYAGQLDWQKISHQVGIANSTGFTPDIVVIACGTNDGVSNLGDYDTAMGKAIGSLDMSLTAEAMRKNFYEISKAYPNAKLFSCLPLQRADVETSTCQPLLDLIRKMSGRYGFTVIDCHNETGIVKDFEVWDSDGRDLSDGLHPKTSGQIKQAKLISAKIKSSYQLQV